LKLYFLSLFVIFIGTFINLFIKNERKTFVSLITMLVSSAVGMIPALNILFSGAVSEIRLSAGYPIGDIVLRMDPLSAFFLVLIYLGSIVSSIYAVDYLKKYSDNPQFSLVSFSFNLLILSMLLLVTMQNIFAFLMVWEAMSLTSFLSILLEGEKRETRRAALEYFVYMDISFVMILTGFLIMSDAMKTTEIMRFAEYFQSNSKYSSLVFILLFFGFAVKAGFVPFHNWLPKAHPASPSHVSGFMSGVMLKMGIYGIMRFSFFLDKPALSEVLTVLFVSYITALLGILYAIFEKDIKKLLAFSSIENIGIIGIGIGLFLLGKRYDNQLISLLGISGALMHSFNHSVFKPLLFFGAGSIYLKTHTRNIEKLGGILKYLPLTSYMFIAGSIAISGLPLLSGFMSELLLYFSAIEGVRSSLIQITAVSIVTIAVLAFIGTMALLCFTKVIGIMLLGARRSKEDPQMKDDMKYSLLSMIILTVIIIFVGFFPQYSILLIKQTVLHSSSSFSLSLFDSIRESLEKVSFVSFIFILIFIGIFTLRQILQKNRKKIVEKVWDCGYQRGSARMEYTGASYVEPLKNITSVLIVEKKTDIDIKEYFPHAKDIEGSREDFFEKYMINPSVKFLKRVFDMFSGIQRGSTQQYILMGMVFLIISLLILIWK
jgi:formate hydrogenlyase subunit 3/multisubunit Na+/H+ antiporter MnhD subunit